MNDKQGLVSLFLNQNAPLVVTGLVAFTFGWAVQGNNVAHNTREIAELKVEQKEEYQELRREIATLTALVRDELAELEDDVDANSADVLVLKQMTGI